jgi:hypothetical protein
MCDDKVNDSREKEEYAHGDRIEDKQQRRAEARLEPMCGPPADPADEPIEREAPGGQGDQHGLLNALLPDVGDRDRDEQDEQGEVPDPGLSPAWDMPRQR